MDSVVHFEIPVKDPDGEGTKFYREVFGWNTDRWQGDFPYWMAMTTEVDEQTRMPKTSGGINGGIMEKDKFQSPIITINVEDLEAKAKLIEEHGGKMIGEKQKVGDMGWSAYFTDNSGNVMGLWQNIKKEG